MNESSVDNDFIRCVVENYSDMILRIAYQSLKSRADAEDIAQEVFMKLLRQPVFNDEKYLKAWLIRVTINQCKDFKKSARYRNTTALTEEWQPFSDEQQSVMEEIWELSVDYRIVIYLYYYEKYTISEIAEILVKKENTISSQLTRARKQLKSILLEGGYHE